METMENFEAYLKRSHEEWDAKLNASQKAWEARQKAWEADREVQKARSAAIDAQREADLKEQKARSAAIDAQIAKTEQSIDRLSEEAAKTERSIDRLSEEAAKTERTVAHVSDQLGRIGNNNGAFAEEYFSNALEEKMVFAGQRFDDIDLKIKGHEGKIKDEFDIVLYNHTSVALIEVKYKIHLNDVEKMVTQKVPNFRTLFPYYKDYKIYLGLASLAFYDDVLDRAHSLGIGVLKQKGETVEYEDTPLKAY
jgi:archaellum component FlaC